MKRRVRFGLIGTGEIAIAHAAALRRLDERAVLVAVADSNPARLVRFAQQHFVPFTYQSAKELLLRDDLDVITLCTPPSTHERLVIEALTTGRYVVCEKPLAHTLSSADRILAHARAYPGRLSVCFQLRYLAPPARIKWLADERGLIPKGGRFTQLTPFPAGTNGSWWGRWSVAGGGVVITRFIHELDMMLHLFGPVSSIEAEMTRLADRTESEDTCRMHARFASGAIVEGVCAIGDGVSKTEFFVDTEEGRLASPWNGRIQSKLIKEAESRIPDWFPQRRPSMVRRAISRALRRSGNAHMIPKPRYVNPHQVYLEAVVDAVENRRDLPLDAGQARQTQELCTAVYESAIRGIPVTPDDSTEWTCYEGIDSARFADAARRRFDALGTFLGHSRQQQVPSPAQS